MDVVTGFAANLLTKLGEQLTVRTGRHLGYVLYYKNYVRSLRGQVKKLEVKSNGITLEINEAIRNGEIIAPQVEEWFTNMEIVLDESYTFLKEVNFTKDMLKCCFPNIKRRYIVGKKAREKTEKVANLIAEMFHKISHPRPPLAVGDRSTNNFRNFESRIPTINQLMEWLKDDNKSIISLCGTEGSGKTTMVEEAARRVKWERVFDEIIYAVVSKENDLIKVQEDLVKWLGLRFKSSNLEGRADELWNRLLQSKKGNLVILDDVWKYIDLKGIGIPFGKGYNCKVLLTSRSEDPCKAMGCSDILRLDMLTPSDAWSLLEEMVGDSINDHDVQDYASGIVKMCGGIPSELVCVGRTLKNKRKDVWKDTLQKLQGSILPEYMEDVDIELNLTISSSSSQ